MKNKCIKCSKELGVYDWGLCYDCNHKQEMFFFKVVAGLIIIILGVFGFKLFWAKYAYNDYRCVFSECRLLKN